MSRGRVPHWRTTAEETLLGESARRSTTQPLYCALMVVGMSHIHHILTVGLVARGRGERRERVAPQASPRTLAKPGKEILIPVVRVGFPFRPTFFVSPRDRNNGRRRPGGGRPSPSKAGAAPAHAARRPCAKERSRFDFPVSSSIKMSSPRCALTPDLV